MCAVGYRSLLVFRKQGFLCLSCTLLILNCNLWFLCTVALWRSVQTKYYITTSDVFFLCFLIMYTCAETTYPRSVELCRWAWVAFMGRDSYIVVKKWNNNHIFIILVLSFTCGIALCTYIHLEWLRWERMADKEHKGYTIK